MRFDFTCCFEARFFYENVCDFFFEAHMQARYVILRVLLNAGEDLVTIKKIIGKDGQPDIVISIDRSKINSVGKAAIGEFLKKLQVELVGLIISGTQ